MSPKLLTLVLSMTIGSAAAASNAYDLQMKLMLGGKPISAPEMIVKAGETATWIQENGATKQFIEVIATEGRLQSHPGILMKFAVGTIDAAGKRTVVSRPQVLTSEGVAARITESDSKTGKERLALTVTAIRTTL